MVRRVLEFLLGFWIIYWGRGLNKSFLFWGVFFVGCSIIVFRKVIEFYRLFKGVCWVVKVSVMEEILLNFFKYWNFYVRGF